MQGDTVYPEPAPEDDFVIWIVIAVIAALVAGVIILTEVVLKKSKKKNNIEVHITKKIIFFLLATVLLSSFVSCKKDGETADRENMTKCTVKVGPEVGVTMWYPNDAGIRRTGKLFIR